MHVCIAPATDDDMQKPRRREQQNPAWPRPLGDSIRRPRLHCTATSPRIRARHSAAVGLRTTAAIEFVRPFKGRRISASCELARARSRGPFFFLTVQETLIITLTGRESYRSPSPIHRSASPQQLQSSLQAGCGHCEPHSEHRWLKRIKPGRTDAFRRACASIAIQQLLLAKRYGWFTARTA